MQAGHTYGIGHEGAIQCMQSGIIAHHEQVRSLQPFVMQVDVICLKHAWEQSHRRTRHDALYALAAQGAGHPM